MTKQATVKPPEGLVQATPMQKNLINTIIKDLVVPMMKGNPIEFFQRRFWHGGYFCDGTDVRYVIFRANPADFPQGIKAVAETMGGLDFEMDLPEDGGTFCEDDIELLAQAKEIEIYDTAGSVVPNLKPTLYPEGTSKEIMGWVVPPEGVKLSKLLARFEFGTKVAEGQNEAVSMFFKPKK